MSHSASGFSAGRRSCVLILSAYYRHKNLKIFPQVAFELQKLEPGIDFEFCLTLAPTTAPWKAILLKSREIGVPDHIKTLGVVPLDALALAYQKASAVLLPTLREASTAVYPESFYFRRPLVASDLDFARELCGDAALYAAPTDAKGFATRLRVLATDDEVVRSQVSRGVRRLEQAYPTAESKLNQQIELLLCIAARSGPHTALARSERS